MPALNEEETVGAVVAAVRAGLDGDVLVVDDGSSDRTAAAARDAGALVLQHPFNLGVGAALRSGFRYARREGYEVVVQVDADGQHDVDAARNLIKRLHDDEVDLVVGSRFDAGYSVGWFRKATMRLLSRVISRRLGVTITDTTSGFRAFGTRAIALFAVTYPTAYLSDTVEALMLSADVGLKVVEEPVTMRPRQGGRPSAGGARSAFHLVRLCLVILLHRIRRPLARRELADVVQT
jgi:glycosyltransferase involved in cell wall biosynthesis